MPISKNAMVTLNYSFRDTEGYLKDFTQTETITYVQGQGHMLPGVERMLQGKSAGDSLTVTLSPTDAFGEYKNEKLSRVPKDQFFGVRDIRLGMQFDRLDDEGKIHISTVVDMDETSVILDGNHPLAGLHIEMRLAVVHVHELRSK